MAFGEENNPPAWSVDVSSFASSLAKQAKATASSLVDEAVAFANEAVTVKTREDLALRPDQHHIALARQHRDLGARSTQLEGLVLEKRRELEESLVRIEELQARAEPLPLPSGYADSCCALVHWCTGAYSAALLLAATPTPWTRPSRPPPRRPSPIASTSWRTPSCGQRCPSPRWRTAGARLPRRCTCR